MAVGTGFNPICGIRKHREICALMVFIGKGKIPYEIILMSIHWPIHWCTNIISLKNLTSRCVQLKKKKYVGVKVMQYLFCMDKSYQFFRAQKYAQQMKEINCTK